MRCSYRSVARWTPAIAWALAIWILSGRPVVPTVPIPYIDKIFHTGEFGVLAVLVSWAALPHLTRYRPFMKWLLIVLVCFFYGIVDEAHQAFVPGRMCDVADAFADLMGAAIATLIFVRLKRTVRCPESEVR